MSLQRRLMIYLLVCAPFVWGVALYVSIDRSRDQVNELYDTELIRLARQVQATLIPALPPAALAQEVPPLPRPGGPDSGESDVRDLALAVWDADGRLLMSDREGVKLPYHRSAVGFVDQTVDSRRWRLYFLQASSGQLVAAGQAAYERDELVLALVGSQIVPWLLVLPVLLLAMGWAVRRALAPIHELTDDLQARSGGDLAPVPDARAPAELRPLLAAMNSLFVRIDELLTRERRFTADVAHEFRTPLAVLRAQWDVVKRSRSDGERAMAEGQMDAGFGRMDRLVTQMLALSRAESATPELLRTEIAWPPVVEQVMGDCLDLAHRRGIELACHWPPSKRPPFPLIADTHLMTVLLRNLRGQRGAICAVRQHRDTANGHRADRGGKRREGRCHPSSWLRSASAFIGHRASPRAAAVWAYPSCGASRNCTGWSSCTTRGQMAGRARARRLTRHRCRFATRNYIGH